jgi:hypothetical protein
MHILLYTESYSIWGLHTLTFMKVERSPSYHKMHVSDKFSAGRSLNCNILTLCPLSIRAYLKTSIRTLRRFGNSANRRKKQRRTFTLAPKNYVTEVRAMTCKALHRPMCRTRSQYNRCFPAPTQRSNFNLRELRKQWCLTMTGII